MAGSGWNDENGWKWLKFAGNSWKWPEWLEIAKTNACRILNGSTCLQMVGNGWIWLEYAGNGLNSRTFLEIPRMDGNGCKWLD